MTEPSPPVAPPTDDDPIRVAAPQMHPRLSVEQLRAAERIREYWASRPASLPAGPPAAEERGSGGMQSDSAASR